MLDSAKKQIGKTHKVLIEKYENGIISGKSDNFYTVKSRGDRSLIGDIVDITITDIKHSTLIGKL